MADKKSASKPASSKDKRVDAIIQVLRENGISLDHHPDLK